jgi:glycerophosphoryl diester phosphodiesterase
MGIGVFGHRGACGYLPENTMPSFELAFEMGSDAIEFDVVLTKDSVPVILHDLDLTKTTNVASHPNLATSVDQLTLLELKQLRVMERYPEQRIESAKHSGQFEIPSLREMLANPAFDGKHLILELKEGKELLTRNLNLVAAVARELADSNWQERGIKLTVESFEFSVLKNATSAFGADIDFVFLSAPETLPEGRASLQDDLLIEIASEFDGVSVAIEMLWQADFVARAKALGLTVFAYTARIETAQGEVESWFEKLVLSGVDGIFADQPDRLIQTVSRLT